MTWRVLIDGTAFFAPFDAPDTERAMAHAAAMTDAMFCGDEWLTPNGETVTVTAVTR